ncbi:biosynthetic peptidoglycan transglycosylase, partial [Acinetobacter baumannii]
GQIIATYGDLYEEMVRIEALPPYVSQAFLALEDRRFYSHFGLDLVGLMRAAYQNYRADRVVQGGSSITQQLAKNFLVMHGLYPVHDRT